MRVLLVFFIIGIYSIPSLWLVGLYIAFDALSLLGNIGGGRGGEAPRHALQHLELDAWLCLDNLFYSESKQENPHFATKKFKYIYGGETISNDAYCEREVNKLLLL